METFCARKPAAFVQSDSVGLYSPIFLPLLRNSESGTIALSRERWKWKWIEFPEIQRVALSPAQAMYKCIYFNCKKLQPRQQQTQNIHDTEVLSPPQCRIYYIHNTNIYNV